MTGIHTHKLALICQGIFFIATASFAQHSGEWEKHIQRLTQTTKHLEEGQVRTVAELDALCQSVISQPVDIESNTPYHHAVYLFAEALTYRGYLVQSSNMCWDGIRRSEMAGDPEYVMFFQLLLVKVHLDYKQPDSARWYLAKLDKLMHKAKNPKISYVYLTTKADLATLENRLYEALHMYSEALDYFEMEQDTFNASMVGTSMADLYYSLGDYQQAIQMLEKYNQYCEEKQHIPSLLNNYINLGVYHSYVDAYDKALNYNTKGLALARKVNDSLNIARLFSNMGNVKRKSGQYSSSLLYQDSALLVCEHIRIPYGIFLNHVNRAELYLDQKMWDQSLNFLQKSMQMTDFYQQPTLQVEVHKLLSRTYEGLGDYRNAFKYSQLQKIVQDSLDKIQSEERLRQLESIYVQEKLNRELAQFKDKAIQSTMKNRLMIFVLVCALLISMIILYRTQGRRRLDALHQRLLQEEKERLELTVRSKDSELLSQALHQASIREMADTLKTELFRLGVVGSKKQKDDIDALIREIESRTEGDQWNEFETRFAQVHEEFYSILKKMSPDLNPSELKICGLLRLNMSSKEIALLTQRTVATIDNNRSTIRKKLNLPSDTNLSSYLLTI